MFANCTSLVNMPNIYATAINGRQTFMGMFSNCTSLANVTPLHITTMYCYDNGDGYGAFESMFYGCTSLTVAPSWTSGYEVLPYNGRYGSSSGFGNRLFKDTFNGCTSLVSCDWKIRCHEEGINTDIAGTLLVDEVINSTFNGCTSLTTPFELSYGPVFGPMHLDDDRFKLTFGDFIRDCSNVTELIFSKWANPINYYIGQPGTTGTIYVADNSVYLDPNYQDYYGQSPISGWTVESINNYPNS